jgi:hypothetical protein
MVRHGFGAAIGLYLLYVPLISVYIVVSSTSLQVRHLNRVSDCDATVFRNILLNLHTHRAFLWNPNVANPTKKCLFFLEQVEVIQ